jgi:hypothetical protein
MQAAASSPSPGSLEIVHTAIDGDHLNYVVNAYIYDEEPGRMVVTCRGEGGGRCADNLGLSQNAWSHLLGKRLSSLMG